MQKFADLSDLFSRAPIDWPKNENGIPRPLQWGETAPIDEDGLTEHQRYLQDLELLRRIGAKIQKGCWLDMSDVELATVALRALKDEIEEEQI